MENLNSDLEKSRIFEIDLFVTEGHDAEAFVHEELRDEGRVLGLVRQAHLLRRRRERLRARARVGARLRRRLRRGLLRLRAPQRDLLRPRHRLRRRLLVRRLARRHLEPRRSRQI